MLEDAGHHVRRACRSSIAGCADAYVIGELSEETEWRDALDGVDVVVHTAARVHVLHESVSDPVSEFRRVNVRSTQHLARQAAQQGVKRLIFISTIGVLGNYSKEPFTEGDKPNPSNIYSMSKWEAEQALLRIADEVKLDVVIIRPPLVYGPGVKANFLRLMQCVNRQHTLPFKWVHNARDFISIGNLCHFIEEVLEHPKAVNETYLVSDNEPISTPDLICALAQHCGVQPKLLPVPTWILRLGAKLLSKERFYHSVCSSLRIDTRKAHDQLGWYPKETMQEGLRQTVDWYLNVCGADTTETPSKEALAA